MGSWDLNCSVSESLPLTDPHWVLRNCRVFHFFPHSPLHIQALSSPALQDPQQAVYKALYISLLLTPKFPASYLTLSPTVNLSLTLAELGLIYISLTNLI